MSFWLYKKKKYNNNVKKILEKNNFFFFWDFKDNSKQKDFLLFLETINLFTFWAKKNVLKNFYTNNTLINGLKSQCYFSYGELEKVNTQEFIKLIKKNEDKLVVLGLLMNNNLYLNHSRLALIEKKFDFNLNSNKYYRILLRNILFYSKMNFIIFFKKFYLPLYKKNFKVI